MMCYHGEPGLSVGVLVCVSVSLVRAWLLSQCETMQVCMCVRMAMRVLTKLCVCLCT